MQEFCSDSNYFSLLCLYQFDGKNKHRWHRHHLNPICPTLWVPAGPSPFLTIFLHQTHQQLDCGDDMKPLPPSPLTLQLQILEIYLFCSSLLCQKPKQIKPPSHQYVAEIQQLIYFQYEFLLPVFPRVEGGGCMSHRSTVYSKHPPRRLALCLKFSRCSPSRCLLTKGSSQIFTSPSHILTEPDVPISCSEFNLDPSGSLSCIQYCQFNKEFKFPWHSLPRLDAIV